MIQIIEPFEKVVLRLPLLPFNEITKILKQNDLKNIIPLFFENDVLKEGLFLASPWLHKKLEKHYNGFIKDEDNFEFVLFRYFLRMCTRCTPFGVFASQSITKIGLNEYLETENNFSKNTKLDMSFLERLTMKFSKDKNIREGLLFFPNNTIYELDGKLRYVEYSYSQNGDKVHNLVAVESNYYLELILGTSLNGCPIKDLVKKITIDEITKEEATDFVNELIQSQLLISDIELTAIGEKPLNQLIQSFSTMLSKNLEEESRIEIGKIFDILINVKNGLKFLDENGVGSDIAAYQKIIHELKGLEVEFDEQFIFNTTLDRNQENRIVDENDVKKIIEGLDILARFSPRHYTSEGTPKNNIKNFIEKFYKKFEEKEVPLSLALDKDLGVDYSFNKFDDGTFSPLVDGIKLPNTERKISEIHWDNDVHSFWLRKYIDAVSCSKREIIINENDMQSFPSREDDLSETLSIMFSLTDESDERKIIIHGSAMTDASRLLGRFCYDNQEILSLTEEILSKKAENVENVIFAEISHIPEARSGNILLRPKLTDYEIPYITKSLNHRNFQLPLHDLMVSVYNGKVVLRSKKLNKIIIPSLSSAHNYSANSLPVYRFLCDLQTQHIKLPYSYLNLGILTFRVQFMPRISYKNIILSPASWTFNKSELSSLKHISIENFIKEKNIPRYVVIAEGDNELLIDFESDYCKRLFKLEIKRKETVQIKEFLFKDFSTPTKDRDGNCYANEFILSFFKNSKSSFYKIEPNSETNNISIKRNFSLGDEWFYIKYYGGVKTTNKILIEIYNSVIKELFYKKIISKWFFIRFADPEPHIRFRFLVTDRKLLGTLIEMINKFNSESIQPNLIWKIQTDTYQREIERYGVKTMELVETIFNIDSNAIMKCLSIINLNYDDKTKWLITLLNINQFLEDFSLPRKEKYNLIKKLRNGFATEFNENKELKQQLSTKYRFHKTEIWELLSSKEVVSSKYPDLFKAGEEKSIQLKKCIENAKKKNINRADLMSLLPSLLHMHINRVFISKQRLHEFVLYDLLNQFYNSEVNREKYYKN